MIPTEGQFALGLGSLCLCVEVLVHSMLLQLNGSCGIGWVGGGVNDACDMVGLGEHVLRAQVGGAHTPGARLGVGGRAV